MKISFVIPAYNEQDYILDCLKSIFNLDGLADYEVIVVDNNSTDKTSEVIKNNFPEAILIKETKKGPAAARNAGAKIALGEFMAFIDADCRLPRDWWMRVEKEFQASEDLVLLYGPYRYFEVKNTVQKIIFYISNVFMVRLGMIFGLSAGYGGNTVIRRVEFIRLGGFGSFEFYGEDVDLIVRASRTGRVKFDPKLWIYSSVRRLKQQGIIRMWWKYTLSSLKVSNTFNKKRPP